MANNQNKTYLKKMLKNKQLKDYVSNAYSISHGNPDHCLFEKSKSLDSIAELDPSDPLWMDFVGAVLDENKVQMKMPETLDKQSYYHFMKAQRYEILIKMFRLYGLLDRTRR